MSTEVSSPANMAMVYVVLSLGPSSAGPPPSGSHGTGKESTGGTSSCNEMIWTRNKVCPSCLELTGQNFSCGSSNH